MNITDEMIKAACVATVLGEDANGVPVHLEHREALTALTAALSHPPVDNPPGTAFDAGQDDIIAWYGTNGAEWRRADGKSPKKMTKPETYCLVSDPAPATHVVGEDE